jgi:indolepyruvate ferredoxin oxidoreductase beta subunit
VRTDCLIVGVGGQGTILASRIVGNAALSLGLDVRGSETIGMAQRGGSVASHIRVGGASSPLISPGGADVILAFELCEGARALPYLARDGVMIVCDRVIQPYSSAGTGGYDAAAVMEGVASAVSRLCVLDGSYIIEHCRVKCLNMAVIGAAVALGALPCSMGDIERTIDARFDSRRSDMNKNALRVGAELAKSYKKQ